MNCWMTNESKKIKVVYFQRKQRAVGNFSVEIYFDKIRNNLPVNFKAELITMPYESTGLFKRIANALYCVNKQGDINHITGDIHYVGTFLKKRKTILTILDCGMLKNVNPVKFFIFKLFWFTIPSWKAAYITVISEATKKDLLRYINFEASKIKVVYVCISDSFYKSDKIFNCEKPRILQIGTAENKNLKRLIPALEGISCEFVIVGRITADINALLRKYNIVYKIIDKAITEAEIIEHYKAADIVSFVSTLEGFGMPIIESNTVGRCVVTSNVSSMPEIAGDAAEIVDPYFTNAIKEGIKKIIDDAGYRQCLIHNGYKNIKRFTIESIIPQYVELYSYLYNSK
jgi:glycosyltransferase involved in cell wall biosynthesis